MMSGHSTAAWLRRAATASDMAWRVAWMEKSAGLSFVNSSRRRGGGAAARNWRTGFMSNCSSGTRSMKPARKKDSLEVFSRRRRTRYAMPGSSPPWGVNTNAVINSHQSGLKGVGQSMKHIKCEFPDGIRYAPCAGVCDGRGDAADVVAGNRRAQQAAILNQKPAAVEAGIGGGFLREDGTRASRSGRRRSFHNPGRRP